MRILVVGAGAVGGYFGARWIAAGRDVTFLVREARRAALAASGLTVTGVRPDLHLHPRAVIAAELDTPYDVVFLTVPGDTLQAAIAEIEPAVGPETVILTSLNGVRHFDALRETFGDDRALGCVVKCVTKLDEAGRIVVLAPLAQISFGSWQGGIDSRLRAIESELRVDDMEVQISAHIREEIHEKWLMMVALGAANSLLGGDVGSINAALFGGWAIQEILREGQRALNEIGMSPRQPVVDALSRLFADPASRQTSSLYRNMLAGRPIELEPIVGDLLSRVADHRLYPLLSAAFVRLSLYVRSRQISGA